MNNFLGVISQSSIKEKKSLFFGVLILFFVIAVSAFFNMALALGLIFVSVLTVILFALLFNLKAFDKKVWLLFLIVGIVHLVIVLFISYAEFRPSGGGADFENYNRSAIEIAQRFKVGNFSLEGVYSTHYFPVLIGLIYMVTAPEMIVGQTFSAWLAAFSAVLTYFLVLEIGGSKKSAFLAGLGMCFYPSYLYFGSLLLKDTIVIPLVLLALILAIQLMKKFEGVRFLLFFLILTTLLHLRFYIGFAVMFSFIIFWFILSKE